MIHKPLSSFSRSEYSWLMDWHAWWMGGESGGGVETFGLLVFVSVVCLMCK